MKKLIAIMLMIILVMFNGMGSNEELAKVGENNH